MLDLSDISVLNKVLSPSGMPYASASENYAFAEFARDAIEASMDLIPTLPEDVARPIAVATIKRLAELQGQTNTEDILEGKDIYHLSSEDEERLEQLTLSEERRGKIHHEHRADKINDTPIPLHAREVFVTLSELWGGTEHEMTYYGSLDATPQYIRLIALYCEYYGKSILEMTYKNKLGKTQTIKDSLFAAVSYIESELEKSSLGLYEMYRINMAGLKNQTWKDSPSAFITLEQTLPDYEKHVIPLSVQGLVYDALIEASELLKDSHPEKLNKWKTLAEKVQQQTLSLLWMNKNQSETSPLLLGEGQGEVKTDYFAQALSLNEEDRWVQIKTLASDAVNLLHTNIFDTCTETEKKQYVGGIVRQIYSEEFVTDVGIRCRAKRHENLVDYSDYHGTDAVWIKETYDCIVGLRKQGFLRLAKQLGIRMLNGLLISGSFYELFFVRSDGRVDFDPNELRVTKAEKQPIYTTAVPENMQTWTISAALSEYKIQHSSLYKKLDKTSWQYALEEELLKTIPSQTLLTTEKEINSALPTQYAFHIDLEGGSKRASKYENLLIHAENPF